MSEHDLSPMRFDSVSRDGRTLAISPPLEMTPTLQHEGYLVAEDESLDLVSVAYSREELALEVTDDLFFFWDCYATGDINSMTDGAQAFAKAILARVRELPIAEGAR